MSSTDSSIEQLKDFTKRDQDACRDLQIEIDRLTMDMDKYKDTPLASTVILPEQADRHITSSLVRRIQAIEDRDVINATDREMLRALEARLAACDQKGMKLARLHDLVLEARGFSHADVFNRHEDANTWLAAEKVAKERKDARRGRQGDRSACISSQKGADAPVTTGTLVDAIAGHGASVTAATAKCVAEPIDPKDVGVTAYAMLPPNVGHARIEDGCGQEQYRDDSGGESDDGDSESGSCETDDEAAPDNTKWPLLYRILDVNPNMDARFKDFDEECRKYEAPPVRVNGSNANPAGARSMKRLAIKHDPKLVPNDSGAPERWVAVMKAYETLTDKDRKNFYDMQGKVPASLEGFDIARLSLEG